MSERRRVLHLGPDPAIGGGMAAAMRGLLGSPLADRYRLELIATYRSPAPLSRLVVFSAALARIAVWCLRGRGRIVHVHATVRGSAYRKAVCVLLAKALRRRVVLHVHSGAGDIAFFAGGRGRLSRALFQAAFSSADAVLAVSTASAEALESAGVSAAIEVVPNAAPLVPLFERPAEADGAVGVVYLGGFANTAKGADVLVEALRIAVAEEAGLRVTLAGPGEPPPDAARWIGGEERVSWAGWLDDQARDSLLRRSPVFVISSRSEGQPMALLEAMSYGMAVVATAVGGIPESIDDETEGLLVPAERPDALAGALVRLARDPALRAELGAAARRRVDGVGAAEVAQRLSELYSRLA